MTVDTRPIATAAVAVDTHSAAMVAVPVCIGMMLLALTVEGLAARLGVEAIDALLARRAVGTCVWRTVLGHPPAPRDSSREIRELDRGLE
jgi:hypothetical protein